VFVSRKTRTLLGPKKLAGLFSAAIFFRKVFCVAPQNVPNFPTIIFGKSSVGHVNLNLKVTQEHSFIVIIIFSNFELYAKKHLSYSCALFLDFYNISIPCHLTSRLVKSSRTTGCLPKWTGKVAYLQQLNITHSKLNRLSCRAFILFGCWQTTQNAIKSESVALKQTNL